MTPVIFSLASWRVNIGGFGPDDAWLLLQSRTCLDAYTMHSFLCMSSTDSVADGLEVDPVNNKLFYTDTGRDVIVSMNLDGTNEQTLISSGLDEPRAIIADPHNRYVDSRVTHT